MATHDFNMSYFRNEIDASRYLLWVLWPHGKQCRRCGHTMTPTRSRPGSLHCSRCRTRSSIRVGTPLEKSSLPISTWLRGVKVIASSPPGLRITNLAATLDVGIGGARKMMIQLRARALPVQLVKDQSSEAFGEVVRSVLGPQPHPLGLGGGAKSAE